MSRTMLGLVCFAGAGLGIGIACFGPVGALFGIPLTFFCLGATIILAVTYGPDTECHRCGSQTRGVRNRIMADEQPAHGPRVWKSCDCEWHTNTRYRT